MQFLNLIVKMQKSIYTLILLVLAFSCNDASNNTNTNNNIKGNYHFLEDTGTQVYLPKGFERYSLVKYQHLLDSISKKQGYDIETPRLKALSKMDGSLYIYYNKNTGATYTVNTIPYYNFTKESGSQLLGMITSTHNKVKEKNNVTFSKVTARSGGNKKQQMFKAVYKVSGKKIKSDLFQTSYIISAKQKTVLIHLTRDFERDFDSYIEKMIFK